MKQLQIINRIKMPKTTVTIKIFLMVMYAAKAATVVVRVRPMLLVIAPTMVGIIPTFRLVAVTIGTAEISSGGVVIRPKSPMPVMRALLL